VGSLRQQLNVDFTEPRFLGRHMSAGVDLYAYRYDLTSYSGYLSTSVGGSVRFGFPLSPYLTLSPRYALHTDDVIVNNGYCDSATPTVSPILCEERGTTLTSAVGYTLRWDHRNDPINPTRGFYGELSQDFAGLGGTVKYLKTQTNAGWYHGFTPDWIFSALESSGYVSGWGGDTVRINDRFYEGGDTFRGFQIAGVGPRDTNSSYNQALGGKLFAIGTLEQTFPDGLPEQYGIKMALFTDFGVVGQLDSIDKVVRNTQSSGPSFVPSPTVKDDTAFRMSVGLSVFWKSPMGPIRLDFSQIIRKAPYDITELFKFSTSTRF
jgi:outer membrane protein insertion porin family